MSRFVKAKPCFFGIILCISTVRYTNVNGIVYERLQSTNINKVSIAQVRERGKERSFFSSNK